MCLCGFKRTSYTNGDLKGSINAGRYTADYLSCGNLPYPAWKYAHDCAPKLQAYPPIFSLTPKAPEARDFSHVRIEFLIHFSIRRNITIIKGDSATGKTTLLRILYEYLRIGRQSGYAVSTNASYYVYIRDEVGRDWKDALYPLKNTVIFIEENNEFVFTKEFASYVKESGNYFVFVTRAPLKMLPYSIHEIYEIITDGKRTDIKESYHEFKEIYSNYTIIENNKIQNVVTEDSNSGYQFWMHAFKNSNVTSLMEMGISLNV